MKDIFQNIDPIEMEKKIEKHIFDTKFYLNMLYGEKIANELIPERDVLRDILTRIEKRRHYFYYYYNRQDLGDINEAALLCFWTIKLMPFKHISINNSDFNVNIGFAFLFYTINYVITYDNTQKKNKKLKFNALSKHNLLYAFKYRDLSKEAIMAIAESLIC